MEGGCACGTVRYRLASTPYDTGWCHCRLCQRVSGSPGLVFTTLPLADFVLTAGAGAVGTVALTDFGERRFCTRCGTPLSIHVAYQADEIDVPVATLDRPDACAPEFHIFVAAAPPWTPLADGLPQFAGERPGTGDR